MQDNLQFNAREIKLKLIVYIEAPIMRHLIKLTEYVLVGSVSNNLI